MGLFMSRRLWIGTCAAACAAWIAAAALEAPLGAQGRQGGGQGAPAAVGRPQAPWDIAGYWVSLVTDDWRYRMLTPPKGNADYVPVTAAARKAMESWDPAKDEAAGEACKGYGAGGVMRQPTRLHITWVNDTTMQMEVSAGTQTRTFKFLPPPAPGDPPPPPGPPSWQGTSTARWTFPLSPLSRAAGAVKTAQLTVTTNGLRPGYVRKNGIPYSANTTITENYVRLADEGDEFLVVTQTVDDPVNFAPPYVKTYEFKRERDGSKWAPTPCVAK
jgi:hypothetical protein